MSRVIIVRGPSGSGKGTWIKENFPDATVCSADHFFLGEGGEYNFVPYKIGEAHSSCLRKFLGLLQDSSDKDIVVDNTFIHHWEYRNYIESARLASVSVKVYEFRITSVEDVKLLAERNVHNVPIDIISRMCCSFEINKKATEIPLNRG